MIGQQSHLIAKIELAEGKATKMIFPGVVGKDGDVLELGPLRDSPDTQRENSAG